MAKTDLTSTKIAKIASKGLKDPKSLTKSEIRSLSGSVLITGAKKPKAKPAKKKSDPAKAKSKKAAAKKKKK